MTLNKSKPKALAEALVWVGLLCVLVAPWFVGVAAIVRALW